MSPSRKKVLRVLRLAAPICLIGAACTFPEVDFLTPGSDAGGTSSSSGSGGPGVDSGQPPDIRFDAASVADVATRSDSEAPVDQGTCTTSWKCDCDKDLYLDDTCVKTEVEAGRDGGFEAGSRPGDCDDLDPVRHPEAGVRSDPPRPGAPGLAGDWNCDGTVTRNPPLVKCAAPTPVTGACNGGTDGYLAPTECGGTNDVYTCPSTLAGGSCDPTVQTTAVKATCQ